jgi:hypothetical protein
MRGLYEKNQNPEEEGHFRRLWLNDCGVRRKNQDSLTDASLPEKTMAIFLIWLIPRTRKKC